MKNSIIIAGFFVVGLLIGFFRLLPENILQIDFSTWVLYALLILVGITVGADIKAFKVIKNMKFKVMLVPLTTIIGTTTGVAVVSMFITGVSLKESIAIGFGFGYYSISSVYISKIAGDVPGVIALLSNIIREIMTLLLAPLMVKYFGKLAPISSGGATSMDTTLSIITKVSGHDFVVISIFHGTVLSLLVPIIIPIFLNF